MKPPPSEIQLQEIMDSIPDAVVRLDLAGKVVFSNRSFREHFCRTGIDPAGAALEAAIVPTRGLRLREWHERGVQGELESGRIEFEGVDDAGKRLWFDVQMRVTEESGRVTGTQAVIRDISALKQAEADKARMQARLFISQKHEALGTLAGGIAHDFNNILSGIINFATLAREDCGPESRQMAEFLEEVLRAGRRAKELVRQIQLFHRSDDAERVPFLLQNVVRDALSLLRATIPATVEITSEIDRAAPLVLANPIQIHQIVVNVAINAVQAMQERGGRLQIRLSPRMLDEGMAQLRPGLRPGAHVCLEVEDDGCGMEPEVLARIFEPYFTTRRAGEGTGLGLPVVYRMVRHHEGAIRITSRPREGTCVEICFPVHVAAPLEAPGRLAGLPRGQGQHILLVDDERPIARSAQLMLERLGYRVSMYLHPEEALAAFWAGPEQFDALVTDLQMPALSGLELSRRVLAARPGLPVYVASGFAGDSGARLLREEGVAALLHKPYELAELAGVLALGWKGGGGEAPRDPRSPPDAGPGS